MKYATIAAALVAAMLTTQAKADADTDFAAKLTAAMVVKTVCDGYDVVAGSGSSKPAVVLAVKAAFLEYAGEPYRAVDMIPSITKTTKAAIEVATALLASDKDGKCKELGGSLVRAGLLERK